jgi:carboxypeptidase Q
MSRLSRALLRLGTAILLFTLLPNAGRAADLQSDTSRILRAAHRSSEAYDRLAELCDEYGNRISGSPRLEEAIDWVAGVMREYGFENVHTEEVMVPHWVRGEEGAYLTSPQRQRLHILGLGRSVGTGGKAIEAPVVRVTNFEELASLDDADVRGRIVFFDVPYEGYGKTVRYRSAGPSAAGRKGAVACFVRSVGLDGMQTPHTGALHYDDESPRIPAAAVSFEDANMMARMLARGDRVVAHLEMEAKNLDEALSHNVIGEIRGRSEPEKIVVLGGHIDSWDVGQGAQDDGVGSMIALHAARLIQRLGLHPDRTIRVVLWTNEEYGLAGGRAYAEAHRDEWDDHVAAIETDSGNGRAHGFQLHLDPKILGEDPTDDEVATLRERGQRVLDPLAALLRPVGADEIGLGHGGADVGPLAKEGVPCLGVAHDTSEYFRIHHTEADTFDRIVREDLDHNVGVLAAMAYYLAGSGVDLRGTSTSP